MRTTIEMAREAAGDDWGLFQEYMPEIHRLVELVRADERARMAEQPAQQEPVAWMLEWTFNGEERGYRLYDDERHCVFDAESDGGVCQPLYTSPPAQRKPLTDEQIIASNYPDGEENGPTIAAPDFELICFARQIEAAHGIKENT